MENKVVSREVAENELFELTQKVMYPRPTLEDVVANYDIVIEAIENGNLVIGEDTLKYTLQDPIKNDNGDISVSELDIRTRVKPSNRANLAKGLDLSKDAANFALRLQAHVINQPTAMLDKLSRYDLRFVETISPIFF